MALNLNIGILGHVDSGKTSLAKTLSEVASTAAFDKDPQSQSRGITLDLGFSSFSIATPSHLQDQIKLDKLQYTLVDCPGHASLIRTIIGGAQIIDIILLVIDITKGIQTQTAECLVIGEIFCEKMIVVLNKADLIPVDKRDNLVNKATKRIRSAIRSTIFKDAPIAAVSVNPNMTPTGVNELIEELAKFSYIPTRQSLGSFIFAVDHCFGVKGKGTVLTGTVLKGCVSVNDVVEVPALKIGRKIKSIQVFRQPVSTISQGDRAGICVGQFESKHFERGLVCSSGATKIIYCCIIAVNKIKYFKYPINSKAKFHISVGYETTMGTITLFSSLTVDSFNLEEEYEFVDGLEPNVDEDTPKLKYFMLIEFEKPVLTIDNALIIGSKLDLQKNTTACRIAFYGNLLHICKDKDYRISFLTKLKIFKLHTKIGVVERVAKDGTVIVRSMFRKGTQLEMFIGLQVRSSVGHVGEIDCAFGKRGKVKVRFENYLNNTLKEALHQENAGEVKQSNRVEVLLTFKKDIYNVNKKIYQ